MEELEKAARGLLYDANYDPAVLEKRKAAKRVLHRLTRCRPMARRIAPSWSWGSLDGLVDAL